MRIGPFEILKTLGTGSYGVVYEAMNTVLTRTVALKELRADTAEARRRAFEEGKALAAVRSRYLVSIFAIHEIDDRVFLESELVEGANLAKRIAEEGLPTSVALSLVRDLLVGIEALHASGITHGDLKPENVMLRHDGSAVIIDFGLASRRAGTVMGGTAQYMAPELFAPPYRTDARADFYSLGMTLYEAIVGTSAIQELFPGLAGSRGPALDHYWQTWALDKSSSPVPVDRVRSDIPEAVSSLIADLMAKAPADRPPSATDALARLRGRGPSNTEAIDATIGPGRDREVRFSPERPKRGTNFLTITLVILALLLGGVATIWYLRRPRAVRVVSTPPGATLFSKGKAFDKATPMTLNVRGRGIRFSAERPGYRPTEFGLPDSGPEATVRLDPVCDSKENPSGSLRVFVGDLVAASVLRVLNAPKTLIVGAGCDADVVLDLDAENLALRDFGGTLLLESWPASAKETPKSLTERLYGVSVAWRLAGSLAPVPARSSETGIEILKRGNTPDASTTLKAGEDRVAYRVRAPFANLVVLEVGPDGNAALLFSSGSGGVQSDSASPRRIPEDPSEWISVVPPQTKSEIVVVLNSPRAADFASLPQVLSGSGIRMVTSDEMEALLKASREHGADWGRAHTVFEVR